MSRTLRRPGRTPGSVNLAVAVAVLAVLLPLLLHAATSAPPTAAEFSPNAQQVIKKAPPGQAAAVNGSGEGAGPGASASPTPTPSVVPSATASPTGLAVAENLLRSCVGPPPLRQIEDPQSPPCVRFFQGDNGGATFRGVTRDSVYIAIPTPENAQAQYTALFNFFNKRFEFYGRKLVPQFCASSGGGSGSRGQADQNADAALAAAGCAGGPPPFASTFYRQQNGAYYMPAMACRYKTIVVGSYSPYDKQFLERCAPYQFQYQMQVDEQFANVGEWLCNRFAGKPARFAGSSDATDLTTVKRKFGIMLEPLTDDDPVARTAVLTPITARLKACGSPVDPADIIINPVADIYDVPSAQNAVLQMKNSGVTSVICMCNFLSFGTIARAAEASRYAPEWMTSSFGLNDINSSFLLGAGPDSQLRHVLGLTFQPRMVNPLENPYNVALQEGDSTQAPDTATTGEAKLEVYRALLLLASGIQMAGPDLNPTTFREGLRSAAFPNPLTSLHAGAVDVRPDGYSLTADAAEWYYDTRARGPFSDSAARPGSVCYLDRGNRRVLGGWPKGDGPFFTGECDSGA